MSFLQTRFTLTGTDLLLISVLIYFIYHVLQQLGGLQHLLGI
jgi:hypothetical protein